MQLNNVVLPAPFGPMRPAIAPRRTPNETPSSATIPPNVTRTPPTSSSGTAAAVIGCPAVTGPAVIGYAVIGRTAPKQPRPDRKDRYCSPCILTGPLAYAKRVV